MQIKESDLLFQFGNSWKLRKYDEHPFYSRLSGAGLKAVDIVSIYQKDKLILWEVKNFNRRKAGLKHNPLLEISSQTMNFLEGIALKAIHTMDALRVIDGYYQRRLWYPMRKRMVSNGYLTFSKWYFWLKAYELSLFDQQPELVLWLEGYQLHPYEISWLKERLKTYVSDVKVINMSDGPVYQGVAVSSMLL